MTIQLPITPETEARLLQQARAAGKDIVSYILEIVEQKLSETTNGHSGLNPDPLRLLQGLDSEVWQGIDPLEYQRQEREGWG